PPHAAAQSRTDLVLPSPSPRHRWTGRCARKCRGPAAMTAARLPSRRHSFAHLIKPIAGAEAGAGGASEEGLVAHSTRHDAGEVALRRRVTRDALHAIDVLLIRLLAARIILLISIPDEFGVAEEDVAVT